MSTLVDVHRLDGRIVSADLDTLPPYAVESEPRVLRLTGFGSRDVIEREIRRYPWGHSEIRCIVVRVNYQNINPEDICVGPHRKMLFRPKPPGERPRSEWPWLDLDGFTLGSPNGFTSSSDRIRIYLNPNIEGEDVYYFAHEVMKVEVVYRSASEVESESRPSKSKPQKVGRPPITPDEDMRLAEDWWAAHNCKSTKEEFCERRGIDVEFLNATLARVRTRRNRVKSP